ncbi:MAG: nicotinate (nicotinamide) nucleotide adenylyltransferase [Candidatus Aminicenantes bacterium RBG_16_63_14]|nr:MAG: nicotinate (nicotinamide) nucleotide adenylyltransferase [Candidatus Aminicenantes bacterium RBG_16_63_14]OGD25959.1 MAG: nicotinate (nicotinamide) nucleotide adenylyltransferase [Candidatus Aminicenantes bacterium RBG_19FT_COMBO_65_30]
METIGLFGGTFDPIHLGHLRAAAEVRRRARLDRVLFIPSYLPPHKKTGAVASAADRLRMVELACSGRAGFEASPIEVEAREKSYSILTLRKLRALSPGARLFFILGVDAFLDIGAWREYHRVLEQCFFIVMGRPGFELDRARDVLGGKLRDSVGPLETGEGAAGLLPPQTRVFLLPIRALDISSTAIREMIRLGKSLDGLVPGSVAAYIRKHQLYRGR